MGKQLILQPAGSGDGAVHYQETISHPVPLSRIGQFVDAGQLKRLTQLYPDSAAAVWGVTPGDDGRNIIRWERVKEGDIAVFSGKGKIFSVGKVTFKIHNKPLALDLWGTNEEGQTWEYVYFLAAVKNVNIPYADFNSLAGYQSNNIIQGFEVLSEEKSVAVLDGLNLDGVDYGPDQQLLTEAKANAANEGAFDANSEEDGRKKALASIVRRQGQPKFRAKLLELYGEKCAISGCDAVQALEAAHIIPYKGDNTNHPSNGILLRADLHTLFDLGLITFDSTDMTVKLAPSLKLTSFADLEGKKLSLPKSTDLRPNTEAIRKHNAFAFSQNKVWAAASLK